ncbi:unnamed protein product, partial [marine sediment metagenome]
CERQRDSRTGEPEDIAMKQGVASPVPSAKRQWQFSTVDSSGFSAGYACSICVGTDGGPHLFYQGRGKGDRPMVSGDFVHAFLHEGNWRSETVDTDCTVFGAVYPAVSRSGTLHLLYQVFNSPGRDGLKYACKRDQAWVTEDIYNKEIPEREMERRFGVTSFSLGLMVTDNFCFAVDRRNKLHLCYLDPEKHVLMYGVKSEERGEWRWEVLEDVGPYELSCSRIWPSIAAGPSGRIFITYKRYQAEADGNPA